MTTDRESRPISENLMHVLAAEDQRRQDQHDQRDRRDADQGIERDPEPQEAPEPRQTFRSTRDAMQELRSRRQEAAELEADQEHQQKKYDEARAASAVRNTANWDQTEQQLAARFDQETAAFNHAAADFVQIQQLAQQNPQSVTPQLRQRLAETARELQDRKQRLSQVPAAFERRASGKVRETQMAVLTRAVPQLADAGNRKRLADWATSKGIPRERVEAETDPAVISQAYRQMVAEERQQAREGRQQQAASWAARHARRGGRPPATSSAEMRDQLRRSGDIRDATATLHMRRLERSR